MDGTDPDGPDDRVGINFVKRDPFRLASSALIISRGLLGLTDDGLALAIQFNSS